MLKVEAHWHVKVLVEIVRFWFLQFVLIIVDKPLLERSRLNHLSPMSSVLCRVPDRHSPMFCCWRSRSTVCLSRTTAGPSPVFWRFVESANMVLIWVGANNLAKQLPHPGLDCQSDRRLRILWLVTLAEKWSRRLCWRHHWSNASSRLLDCTAVYQ